MPEFEYWNSGSIAYSKLMEVKSALVASGLTTALLELVFLRVSQINGCSYCIGLHRAAATNAGATEAQVERVNTAAITIGKAGDFSALERAAINWAECLTTLSDPSRITTESAALAPMMSPRQLTDLTVAIALMNALNRLSIGLRNSSVVNNRLDSADGIDK